MFLINNLDTGDCYIIKIMCFHSGRPRKIVIEPGIAEGPEIQDTLNTEHGDGLIQPTPTPEVDCVPGNVQSEGKKTKSLRVKSGNFSHAGELKFTILCIYYMKDVLLWLCM